MNFDLLIHNVHVLTIDGAQPIVLRDHAIAIEGGKIAAIAPHIDHGHAREHIDARGMLAAPGLVNSHAHVAMGIFRGIAEDVPLDQWFNQYIWPMETNLTAEDVYWGTLLGLAEMIENGVTTVADHYFQLDQVARAVEESGMRAVLAEALFGGAGAAERLAASLAFAQQRHGSAAGRISVVLGPHSPYTCEPAFLVTVAQSAAQHGLGIHIHLSETVEQVEASLVRHSKTPVALLQECGIFDVPCIAAHVAHPAHGDLAILRQHGVGVACCPKTSMKLGIGVAPVHALRSAGVVVGIGSDGAASNNNYDILEATRLIALLEKHTLADARALPVGEALGLATHEGARVLGLADSIGTIEVGKQADLVLLKVDGTHHAPQHDLAANLLYSARSTDVDTVFVNGQILMRERRLLTIDKTRVLDEINTRCERLTQRRAGERMQQYPGA
jgi:5-methylthioadenosine/S-adenosylhomocysteine deaminase